MKNTLTILFLSIGLSFSAQVGIKTDTPKAKLDVNGDANFRGKIALLTIGDNKLNEGTNGQILVSQGEGNPPAWKTLRIPEYEPNNFYLIFNNSFSDKTGIKFTNSEESAITNRSTAFTKNVTYNSLNGFKKITGLSSQPIHVYSTESKTYFQFETVIQANFGAVGTTDASIDYACGIFVDDKLVNLRQGNIKASNFTDPFLTHNQIGIIENLAKGTHTISVACSRLKSYNTGTGIQLAIGINTSSNIDSFISQSSLKVDVYEVPQVFNTILN
ncbi:hypothetical protein ACM39_10520 [Chryseobacterium sp. FH2]|uniref:hypothetical protein n=1 Tax=Chryseobacterium sp. FH2 TaxID=1674291 RepID=UPI00065ADDA3|nr:hypothetical protein [Chryseobacterium sp. FH2]KMQ68263.1 hypothetical protein ACM39_10520 [Chryseobacterium sp. FH2]